MKKVIIAALAAITLAFSAGCGQNTQNTQTSNEMPISINFNNKELSVPEPYSQPFSSEGSIYMPMEVFFDAMHVQAQWNKDTGVITAYDSEWKQMTLKVDSSKMVYDNEEITLGGPVKVKDDKVLIPVEKIVIAMGGDINWNSSTKTLHIDYNEPEFKSGPAYKSISEVNAAIGGAYEVRELVNPMYDIIGYNYSADTGETDIVGEWAVGSGGGFVIAMVKGSSGFSAMLSDAKPSEEYVAENGKKAMLFKDNADANTVKALFEHGGYTFCISMTGNDWEPSAAVKEIIKNIESTY